MRIRQKVLIVFLPLALVASGILSWLIKKSVHAVVVGEVERKGLALAANLAVMGEQAFRLRSERLLLAHLQTSLLAGALYSAALDKEGFVLAHTNVLEKGKRQVDPASQKALREDTPWVQLAWKGDHPVLEVFSPVWTRDSITGKEDFLISGGTNAKGKTRLGTVRLGLTLEDAFQAETNLIRRTFTILAVGGGLLLAMLLFMIRAVLIPIERLTQATSQIETGHYDILIPILSDDELGDLARRFNAMAKALAETTISRDHLDAILGNMRDPLIVTHPDGTIRMPNQATLNLLGYTQDQLVGKSFGFLLDADAPITTNIQEFLAQGSARQQELSLRAKDGAPISVLLSGSNYNDQAGRNAGFIFVAKDIRERKKAEQALARKAQQLADSNAELERFAYAASHDLQEPLRKVTNFTQLLAQRYRGKLDADADKLIAYVVDGAGRMVMLINALLEYSRIGKGEAALERTDMDALLKQVLADLELQIRESGTMISHDTLPTLRINRLRISEVLMNLISNAIKFRDEKAPRIHLGAQRKNGNWEFCVQDNGIGIDPQYAGQLFVMFKRLHGRAKYPGTGIGLAICKKIIEQHHGRIWIESQPSQGAKFVFTLPA